MKKTLLILMTLCTVVIGYSQTFTALDNNNNTLEYNITSANTVEVKDYISGGLDIDIPSTVDNTVSTVTTTYTVTAIGNSAFLSNGLESVVIPDSVISIGIGAFNGNALTTAIIGNSVESIGNIAFFNNQLNNITIPSNVNSIGSSAFLNNPLTCIISEGSIPATIITPPTGGNTSTDSFSSSRTIIDLSIPSGTASAYATAQWTGFKSVAEGLTGTFVVDHITYQILSNPNNEVTVTDYNTTGGTVVDIPATITSGCTEFSVVAIGNSAFQSNSLTSVTIPDSVITIGEGAFNNNNIDTLSLGNSVEIIGNWAFQYNNLENVTIPNSVISINNRAFNANSIINLSLGNSVETIGDLAFAYSGISSITIPDSVLTIGDSAFVTNSGLSNLLIGNSVVSIGDNAFNSYNASTITSITIPSSVTTIGDYAFLIPSLIDVYSLGTTPPTIVTGTNDTFTSIANRANIHLHIPAGASVLDTYTNAANGALWTGFNPVTQDALLSTSNFELANSITVITKTDELKVVTSGNDRLENYTIYSITGAKIKEGTESIIAIDAMSNGIYILELIFDSGRLVKKFAK